MLCSFVLCYEAENRTFQELHEPILAKFGTSEYTSGLLKSAKFRHKSMGTAKPKFVQNMFFANPLPR